jgi:ParB family chromosome partitioning protein
MIKQKQSKMMYATSDGNPTDRDFYGTPWQWIECCREVMGSIELDPASCRAANETVVFADRFYDETIDGLHEQWACKTLFLNPPYSNSAGTRTLEAFAEKFCNQWDRGMIGQAIVVVNNTTETYAFELFSQRSAARAEPRKRIQFMGVDGRSNGGNTRGQVFFYCGRRLKRFAAVFAAVDCRIIQEVKKHG